MNVAVADPDSELPAHARGEAVTAEWNELALDIVALRQKAPPVRRRAFDPAQFAQMKAIQGALQKLVKEALPSIRRELRVADDVKITALFPVSRKGGKGVTDVYRRLITVILTTEGSKLSQAAIQQKVQAEFPELYVTKNWNTRLPRWAVAEVTGKLQELGSPYSSISLKSGTTLSSLHSASRTAVAMAANGSTSFRANVEVGKQYVTIDGTEFKISSNGGYPSVRVTVAALMSMAARKPLRRNKAVD